MTKKILIIAATILMSIGTLMADNDKIIDQKELPAKAKEFYGMLSVGCPVIIHY